MCAMLWYEFGLFCVFFFSPQTMFAFHDMVNAFLIVICTVKLFIGRWIKKKEIGADICSE